MCLVYLFIFIKINLKFYRCVRWQEKLSSDYPQLVDDLLLESCGQMAFCTWKVITEIVIKRLCDSVAYFDVTENYGKYYY